MPKFPGDAHTMLRYINGTLYRGWYECDAREEAKGLAKRLRDSGLSARAITIGEGSRMNWAVAAPERYIVYVPRDTTDFDKAYAVLTEGTIQPLVETPKEAVTMPTKMKPIKITDEQDAAVDPLVKASGDKSFSDLVRRLLAQEAARLGVEWPDNMPTRDETIKKAYQARWPTKEDKD